MKNFYFFFEKSVSHILTFRTLLFGRDTQRLSAWQTVNVQQREKLLLTKLDHYTIVVHCFRQVALWNIQTRTCFSEFFVLYALDCKRASFKKQYVPGSRDMHVIFDQRPFLTNWDCFRCVPGLGGQQWTCFLNIGKKKYGKKQHLCTTTKNWLCTNFISSSSSSSKQTGS